MKTKSEKLFEQFLTANDLPFSKIGEVDNARRPDYSVIVGGGEIIFEIKELTEDENYGRVKDPSRPDIKSSSRTMGNHVRRKIRDSKRQIQFGADHDTPAILLIYNELDPIQLFGTEPMDFIAAMYGAYTIVIDPQSQSASDWYNGTGRMLQENVNTSFSAVGHLCDRGGRVTVTLYENIYAKIKVPCAELPACFEVQHVNPK